MVDERWKLVFLEEGIREFGVCDSERLKPFFPNAATRRLGFDGTRVMVCLFPYYPKNLPKKRNLALYSVYPDYHQIIGNRLESMAKQLRVYYPDYHFKGFVDTSPINEVKAGALCGLGNIGESGLLIHHRYGAFHFIGEIITDLPLPLLVREGREGCVHCGRCRAVCPSGALLEGFQAERCLSAVTQRKGELTEEEQTLLRKQGLAWGCDCCSFACPIAVEGEELSGDCVEVVTAENLSLLLKSRPFAWRGAKVMERNLKILEGNRGT